MHVVPTKGLHSTCLAQLWHLGTISVRTVGLYGSHTQTIWRWVERKYAILYIVQIKMLLLFLMISWNLRFTKMILDDDILFLV